LSCASTNGKRPVESKNIPRQSIQKIIKVTPKFVLIDTNDGVAESLIKTNVHRMISHSMTTVGTVQLVKFYEGRAVAKIVDQEEERPIKVGDYIYLSYKPVDKMNVAEYIKNIGHMNGR
jgi:hypothetical protein